MQHKLINILVIWQAGYLTAGYLTNKKRFCIQPYNKESRVAQSIEKKIAEKLRKKYRIVPGKIG